VPSVVAPSVVGSPVVDVVGSVVPPPVVGSPPVPSDTIVPADVDGSSVALAVVAGVGPQAAASRANEQSQRFMPAV